MEVMSRPMEASLPTLTCTSHLKAPRKGWLQTSLFAYKHRDPENKKFSNGTCKLRGAGLVAVKTGVASPPPAPRVVGAFLNTATGCRCATGLGLCEHLSGC